MRKILISVTILLAFYQASSQDIIVTNPGDTIDCKITRITDQFIHFTIYDQSGIILMRSRLPISGIQYYSQDLNEEKRSDLPEELRTEDKFILDEFRPPNVRISLNAGYTYQFGGYDGLPESYKTQLQSLWNFGGEFNYFPTENLGFGIKYIRAITDANQDLAGVNGNILRFRDERVKFDYYGFSVIYRDLITDEHLLHYFLSGGLLNYRTDLKINDEPYYQDGSTFGVTFGIVYDWRFLESFGVGVGMEVLIANLSEYDDNGTVVSSDFNVSRIDLTLGMRFYK